MACVTRMARSHSRQGPGVLLPAPVSGGGDGRAAVKYFLPGLETSLVPSPQTRQGVCTLFAENTVTSPKSQARTGDIFILMLPPSQRGANGSL